MINRIDALIEELGELCNEFSEVANAESNWHVACRLSVYTEHVERGIEGLYEMRGYLSVLTEWKLEQLHVRYTDDFGDEYGNDEKAV